jgi:UTP--glucose-1-phosphate uridylyltransferase
VITKAVILAAGYGSRFLPITRTVPKEMLPVGTRPALDLVVDELVQAGITDLLVITSRRKKVLEDWFDRTPELETTFAGNESKLRHLATPLIRTQFVRQAQMLGTGHALLLARTFAGPDPVVVCYPDDLFGPPNVTAQLIATHAQTGACVLAVRDLGEADVSRYGVVAVHDREDGAMGVSGFVEKPAPGTEPSKLVSLGRFVYTPQMFDLLEEGLALHTTGEYYHVHALEALAAQGRLVAHVVASTHHDTGEPGGYLRTVITHALADPDQGPALAAWLRARIEPGAG